MKKIAHWLLEKAKKDMRTDPFTQHLHGGLSCLTILIT